MLPLTWGIDFLFTPCHSYLIQYKLTWNQDWEICFSLPVTEILTESLKTELKSRLETLFWYWHWYNPSLSKLTLRILKVVELVLDVWVFLNEPEVFCRMNVPPKCWVETEQVKLTSWPQVTTPAGFMEMLGFGRLTVKIIQEKSDLQYIAFEVRSWPLFQSLPFLFN